MEEARVAGASEKVGGRSGVWTKCLVWPEGNPARTPWETEEKSSEFTRRDFEDKGCGRTKSLCPVQVPLPKEQGWFAPCVAEEKNENV